MQCTLKILLAGLVLCFAGVCSPVLAGEADIVGVNVRKTGANVYTFRVTVRHKDAG
jgi:hypothetical protein